MSDESNQRSREFFRFLTAILTLIFVFGTSITLMNFFAKIVQWNGNLGQVVNFRDLNFLKPFENLLDPFAKWIGWRTDWIANFLVFGFFFYTLMLCVSKLQSNWDKDNWLTAVTTWPLGVLAWPGMIAMLLKTLKEDFYQRDKRKFVSIAFSPFLIFATLFVVNLFG